MAVALGLLPDRALLADVNSHLIHFYQWIQDGLMIDIDMRNDRDCFDAARRRFNSLIAAGKAGCDEAAGLFYYLNRTCFNGLCRFNRSGEYNVPFGRYKTINYIRDFTGYQPVLSRWEVLRRDFEELDLLPEDFIYADPPYDVEFRQYSSGGFTWDDQVRLARWLAEHPGPVVASNQATDRVLDLYRELGFSLDTRLAPRLIACNGDRTQAMEMVATLHL